MKKASVETFLVNGSRRIKLLFDYDAEIVKYLKTIKGSIWSAAGKYWHLPYNDESIGDLNKIRRQLSIELSGFEKLRYDRRTKYFDRTILGEERDAIDKFSEYLKANRYSNKTVLLYKTSVETFISFINKRLRDITNNDFIKFNTDYIIKNNLSQSYQNQVISAVKLFFGIIIGNEFFTEKITRPRRNFKVPEVFGVKELERFLTVIRNRKHRSAMSLIYACGLRRSELLNLRISDIDSGRKVIIIRAAKGNKDRIVPIPESMIKLLRDYYKEFRPRYWLFEGSKPGERYSESSLREAFIKGLKDSKIGRNLTLHSLRHSYATHLLESGTDLRLIQILLGHKSSRTTEIYTHVSTKEIERVRSPFEQLNIEQINAT